MTDRRYTVPPEDTDEDAPPFLQSWKRIYLVVLSYLFTLIIVLWLITKHFAVR